MTHYSSPFGPLFSTDVTSLFWLVIPPISACPQPNIGCCSPHRARLWPSELLCVILVFEDNGKRSMWWMVFMRAEYWWLDGSELRLWEGEHQSEYITPTLSTLPLFPDSSPFLFFSFIYHSVFFPPFLNPLFSSSASCNWSLTQTLRALWIHSSSISLLLPIKQSSNNDTHNSHTWQSGAGDKCLLY